MAQLKNSDLEKTLVDLNKALSDVTTILHQSNDADEQLIKHKKELNKRIAFFDAKQEEFEKNQLIKQGKKLLKVNDFYTKQVSDINKRLKEFGLIKGKVDMSNKQHVDIFRKQVEYQRADVDFQKKKIQESRDLWYEETSARKRGVSVLKGSIAKSVEGFFGNNDLGKIINFGSKLAFGKDLSQTGVKGERKLIQDEKTLNDAKHIEQQETLLSEFADLNTSIRDSVDAIKDVGGYIREVKYDTKNARNKSGKVPNRTEADGIGDGVNRNAIWSHLINDEQPKKRGRRRSKGSSGLDDIDVGSSSTSLSSDYGIANWIINSNFRTKSRLFGYEFAKGMKMLGSGSAETTSLRKDGLRGKTSGNAKDYFLKDNSGGIMGAFATLAGLVGIGGLVGFLLFNKSEYLGTMIKDITKLGIVFTKALTMPFKVGAKVVTELMPKLTGSIAKSISQSTIGKVLSKVATGPKFLQVAKSGFLNVGEKVVTKGAGLVGKVGGKFAGGIAKKLGMSVLKKIPGFGLLISIPLAINRFRKGDFIGGLLELASGGASTIPVIGTALSIAIDAFSLFRDVKSDLTKTQEAPPLPSVEKGALKKMISGKDVKIANGSKQNLVDVNKTNDNTIDLNIKVPNKDEKDSRLVAALSSALTTSLGSDDYFARMAKSNWKEADRSGVLSKSPSLTGNSGGLT